MNDRHEVEIFNVKSVKSKAKCFTSCVLLNIQTVGHIMSDNNAIENNIPSIIPSLAALGLPDIKKNKDGTDKPLGTIENLEHILKSQNITPLYNELTSEYTALNVNDAMTQPEAYSLIKSICERAGLPMRCVDDHYQTLCERGRFHPIRDYIQHYYNELNSYKEKTDSEPEWYRDSPTIEEIVFSMNTKDLGNAIEIMRAWLVGCVAMLFENKTQTKLIPVIKSDESYRKSAFIERIASVCDGAFLGGHGLNPDRPDTVREALESWIVELGELERTTKKEDSFIKAFATKTEDKYRIPFNRFSTSKRRRTAFIGTVNDDRFLSESTGFSRWGVIELESQIDLDSINNRLGYEFKNSKVTLVDPLRLAGFWVRIYERYLAGEAWHISEHYQQAIIEQNQKYTDLGRYADLVESIAISGEKPSGVSEDYFTATQIADAKSVPSSAVRQLSRSLSLAVSAGLIEQKSQAPSSRKSKKFLVRLPSKFMLKNSQI